MSKLPPVRSLLLLGLALIASRTVAAEGALFQGNDWTLLDFKRVTQAAADENLARNPNCDAVGVDERIVEIYRADGTYDAQDESFTKVLTEKGKNDNAVLTQSFILPYFTTKVARLEVIKPDGTTVPVDIAANSKESIDHSQMDENIYDPNNRVLQVNIPGLEVGDLVHSVIQTITSRPIIPQAFSDNFLFEGRQYIRHVSCEIRGPAAVPLKPIAVRDPVGGTVTYSARSAGDGTMVYDWDVKRVPRMFDEPSMPSFDMVLQRLLVSTIADWPAVSRWYGELSEPHLAATSPEMRQKVDELTAGATSGLEKARAIFEYVSKNIRYMGVTPEQDRPGFEPHDVKLTFAKKYGVCRDKAALLVAMLRMAGQQAYPVLMNVGSRLDQQVPSPDFNHAIVALESGPGREILMDPTDEHTRVFLPAYDGNQSYLVCRAEGEDLKISPVPPPDENMMRITTSGTLTAAGALIATSELSFGGVNDDVYRGAFSEMKPDDRQRFFESRLQRAIPGARLTSLRISPENILDESTPLHATLSFSVSAMTAFGRHQAIVNLPWIGRNFGMVNSILDGTGLAERKYPLETEVTCGLDEDVSLTLAGDFGAADSMPSPSTVDDESVAYFRHFGFKDRILRGATELKLKRVEFSPPQYRELKQTLKNLGYDDRKAPVMAISVLPVAAPAVAAAAATSGTAVESNAAILIDAHQLAIQDAHTAVLTVRYVKRILTYAGKIGESELKIPYNPATEEVTLLHATVISASGQRQDASKDEINVMDADWNASAGRYTGGKIFVDSLPGVEIGSTIDVSYEIAMRRKAYLSGFESFQLPDELDEKSFRITAPDGLKVRVRESGPHGFMAKQDNSSGGRQAWEWQAKHVPAVPEETEAPPDWDYLAGVDYYAGDPAAYLSELRQAMLERAGRGPNARALALRLAGHAKSRGDLVKAIRDYIDENVRVAGPSFTELPLGELSTADTTLADGYGHEADRAILFHAMLSAAGFQPEYVLASDLPPIPGLTAMASAFPRPDEFSVPLVRVRVDAETVYLNDTDQYARLGSTPHDDRLGIVLGSNACETIKGAPNCADRVVTNYSLSLSDTGNATIGVRHDYYGIAFDQAKRRFSEMRPEEKAREFQQTVSGVAQGARPVGGWATNFEVYPGVEQFTVEVDRYGIADGRFLYFNLPFTPQLLPARTNGRTLPLFVTSEFESTIRAEISLPPKYQNVAILPKAAILTGPDGAGSARIESTPGRGHYVITYQLNRRPAIIGPANHPAALAVEATLENKAARELLLERP